LHRATFVTQVGISNEDRGDDGKIELIDPHPPLDISLSGINEAFVNFDPLSYFIQNSYVLASSI
jgi:hypothetical protein